MMHGTINIKYKKLSSEDLGFTQIPKTKAYCEPEQIYYVWQILGYISR